MTDYDRCGEHSLDCKCLSCSIDLDKMNPTFLRDKCDRITGLLHCLAMVVDTDGFQSYVCKPHHHLLAVIEDLVDEVEIGLKEL